MTTDVCLLLSGGVASALLLAELDGSGHRVHCLTFDYGQANRKELDSSIKLADHYGIQNFHIERMSQPVRGDLSYSDPRLALLMFSRSVVYSQQAGSDRIYMGYMAASGGHRSSDFLAIARVAEMGSLYMTPLGIRIEFPFYYKKQEELLYKARITGVPLEITTSCQMPQVGGVECGHCRKCEMLAYKQQLIAEDKKKTLRSEDPKVSENRAGLLLAALATLAMTLATVAATTGFGLGPGLSHRLRGQSSCCGDSESQAQSRNQGSFHVT